MQYVSHHSIILTGLAKQDFSLPLEKLFFLSESAAPAGEPGSSAEEGGGADRAVEAGERKSSGGGGSAYHRHTVHPNTG